MQGYDVIGVAATGSGKTLDSIDPSGIEHDRSIQVAG